MEVFIMLVLVSYTRGSCMWKDSSCWFWYVTLRGVSVEGFIMLILINYTREGCLQTDSSYWFW